MVGKLSALRSQISNNTLIRNPQVKLHHLKPQNLKHLEIIKVSDKPTNGTSLESSQL